MVLHPRSARVSRPGLSLSIFGSHPRTTAGSLAVHRSTASTSMKRAVSVGAPAASPPATDDTKAAIRAPRDVACRRRFSGVIDNDRCVPRSPAPGPSELVERVDRPQMPEGAQGINLLHVVGQERPRPKEARVALVGLHRGLPSPAQTSHTPRITGAECSRWTAPHAPGALTHALMPPDTTGLAREHHVTPEYVLRAMAVLPKGRRPHLPRRDADTGRGQFTHRTMVATSRPCRRS